MRAVLTLAFLAPLAGAQATWYVDVNGTPPGTGTLADPYTSIQYAIDQPTTVQPDTVSVAPGTYVENVRLNGKELRLVGSGAGVSVIQAAGPGTVVRLDAYGGELSGFTITGGHGPAPVDAVTENNAWSGTIAHCLIVGNSDRGLKLTSSSGYGQVLHNTITGNGGAGLIMTIPAGAEIRNNVIWGNGAPLNYSTGPHGVGFIRYNRLDNLSFANNCNKWVLCQNHTWDPLFVDAAAGDYRLRLGSSCIDGGDPYGPLDPDGTPPDIGAFPFDPAASPGPTVYCTSKVNSQGCTPAIGFTGSPSASGSPFDVTCSDVVNNKLGLLFYGYQAKALPYQEGTLCVSSPVKRTYLQNAGGNPPPEDCSGHYTFDFDAHIQSGVDPNLVSGALIYAQYWYRDPSHPGAFTTGRSDAVAFSILP